ncbi:xanthine dehydrogenase family protein molybdopterin-binding subunit [Massilia sp. CFBP9026]|uniref:xanthine dehydrogenase family protein molybdopterin-binding subunit n=1 Tax=Massilia sp. CFBP9026 TaxID=3096536 RepID=UPI002A6AB5AF|nr:xanthine dehydrogenase family protein molybdopterin-binding subunit [Massilia sp. CFBP9026]MDY0961136.1 xanthine dehydrogenase family protein molybdopterin-binding subunit [Massilia sp. CFBP9026]
MKIVQNIQKAGQAIMQKAVALAPDRYVTGGKPDPLTSSDDPLIGAPVSRLDGPVKVKGEAKYAAEFALDGMVHGALVYSTVAKGRIAALDVAKAEAAPGVVLVMSHLNAPKMQPPPLLMREPLGGSGDALPVFQDDRVHWNGQPVALVLAESREQADHAASLLRVRYDVEDGVTSMEAARAAGIKVAEFMGAPLQNVIGDAEAALASAAQRVDQLYGTPRQNHHAIELHAVTVAWEGEVLRVHDSTQGVVNAAFTLAQVFGIAQEQVRVTSPFVGGGFGGKLVWRHHLLAAAASKASGRPVRIMLSREGVCRAVGGRTTTAQRVAIGADRDGRFMSLIHTGVAVMTEYNAMPEPFIHNARVLYAAPSMKLEVQAMNMNMVANVPMRAPGESVGSFALESAVDELAEQLGIDPIVLRRRNEPVQDPTEGTPFSSRHLIEAYRAGAQAFGWQERHAKPRMRQEGEWLVGLGCATAVFPYYRMEGGAARIVLSRDGHARVSVGVHEMGMGTATAQTQLCAVRLGLPMEQVSFDYGDSALPGAVLAGGSQQTAVVAAAVKAAHAALCAELLKLAGRESPLAGLKPEQVRSRDGGLCKADDAGRWESYADILARAGRDEVEVTAKAPPSQESEHWSMHSYGAIFCEARVNVVTGEPRVTRLLGSFDVGRILNAKTAASQLRGGMIMGLGAALMEETHLDERNGRVVNASLSEYHVPAHLDVPEVEVMWLDIPDPHAPAGMRGVGEIGITGTMAAIANAVYNACGKRVRELPITLDKLM